MKNLIGPPSIDPGVNKTMELWLQRCNKGTPPSSYVGRDCRYKSARRHKPQTHTQPKPLDMDFRQGLAMDNISVVGCIGLHIRIERKIFSQSHLAGRGLTKPFDGSGA